MLFSCVKFFVGKWGKFSVIECTNLDHNDHWMSTIALNQKWLRNLPPPFDYTKPPTGQLTPKVPEKGMSFMGGELPLNLTPLMFWAPEQTPFLEDDEPKKRTTKKLENKVYPQKYKHRSENKTLLQRISFRNHFYISNSKISVETGSNWKWFGLLSFSFDIFISETKLLQTSQNLPKVCMWKNGFFAEKSFSREEIVFHNKLKTRAMSAHDVSIKGDQKDLASNKKTEF